MIMKPFLMGSEVEGSLSVSPLERRTCRSILHQWILDEIRREHRWLNDCQSSAGIYLDNGSRYYLDSGEHNEFSSPEVFNPRQIATYDRASERILFRAKSAVASRRGIDVCITKNNVNFHMPDQAAWGQHEAYTCWIPLATAAAQLIPHLVSRVPYAGAGCLSSHAKGIGFELSQRARHMTRLTGAETTRDRAIFCTRAWKPSDSSADGWTRTNLISKDSQRCSYGLYLSFGVTGVLFMIMNEGHKIGRRVKLQKPVEAMRAFSLDPWLKTKVPLTNGKQATAVDIQRAYAHEAKPHVESGDYPEWTVEVFNHWMATLDQLEDDPLSLAHRLDPYLKLTLFDRQLMREGMSWVTLRQSLATLDQLRSLAPESVVQAVLEEDSSALDGEYRTYYDELSRCPDLRHGGRDRLRFAVRMQAFELNYHELGGWFDQIAADGHVDSVVVSGQDVEHAVHNPPAGGRAEARSKTISEFHGRPWSCDWQHVISHEEKKWVDLRDPFSDKRMVTALDPNVQEHRRYADIQALLARLRG